MNIDKSAYLKLQATAVKPQPPVPASTGSEQQSLIGDKLEQVCSEFASIFWQSLIKSMHSTIPESSSGQKIQGKELLNSVVDQKMAQFMASQNGAGLKELLLRKFQNHDT